MKPYYEEAGIIIYNCDCREILSSFRLVDLVLTDPPYGMRWNTDSTRFSGGDKRSVIRRGKGKNYKKRIFGDDGPFDPSPWLAYPFVILWGFQHFASSLPVGTILVWIKRLDGAFGSFLSDAELAWMKGGQGVYCKRDLFSYIATATREHPTQKPVSIMQWCITRSKATGTILDPYMGSGTTLIAAKQLGRKAIGVEIEEHYCEIGAKRLMQDMLPLALTSKTKLDLQFDMFHEER